MVKNMCKSAGIEGKKTNHSLRVPAATRLYQANVKERQVCEITGHRSAAVRTYKRPSDEQKYGLSNILTTKKAREDTASCTITTDPSKEEETPDTVSPREEGKLTRRNITFIMFEGTYKKKINHLKSFIIRLLFTD